MIEAFVDCIPPSATSQGKGLDTRGKYPRFYKKPRQKAAENMLSMLFAPHRPRQPLKGPLSLELRFYFPWRESEKKSVLARGLPVLKDTTPDYDNLAKGLQDVLSGLRYWYNDSQIAMTFIAKYWAARPGIQLCVKELHG